SAAAEGFALGSGAYRDGIGAFRRRGSRRDHHGDGHRNFAQSGAGRSERATSPLDRARIYHARAQDHSGQPSARGKAARDHARDAAQAHRNLRHYERAHDLVKAWRWNGAAFEEGDSVPVEDRGFRYGMSFFESVRVWRARPLFLDAHLRRLRQACAESQFPLEKKTLEAIEPLLAGAGFDGFARLYVPAGDGPVATPAEHTRIFVLREERAWSQLPPSNVMIAPEPHRPLFAGLKTANYWANIDA